MDYCPKCKSDKLEFDNIKRFFCPSCSWEFFKNTAAAVAGIIEYKDKILVLERNCDPGKGMLDFPGGFVDPLESAENALRREIKEELNVKLDELRFLCTAPNLYKYKSIEYSTCDIFYLAKVNTDIFQPDKTEIASILWLEKQDLDPEKFAFLSMKEAIEYYKSTVL